VNSFRVSTTCIAVLGIVSAVWASAGPALAATVVPLPATLDPQTLTAIAAVSRTGGGAVVIVDGSTALKPSMSTPANRALWHNAVARLDPAELTVIIERPGPTGPGGALLFALARTRIAVTGADVSQVPPVLFSADSVPGACDNAMCRRVEAAALPVADAPASKVLILPAQQPVPSPTVRPSTPAPTPVRSNPAAGPRSHTPPGNQASRWLVVVLALLLGAGLAWLAVRWMHRDRASDKAVPDGSGEPAIVPYAAKKGVGEETTTSVDRGSAAGGNAEPDRRQPVLPGPGEGIVATALAPEGYVEIDGLLYRVTWRGSGARPRPGAVVAVSPDTRGGRVASTADRSGGVPGDLG